MNAKYGFSSVDFWVINASMFSAGCLFIAYALTLGEQYQLYSGGIFIVFAIIRTFVKPRPPKYLVINLEDGTVTIQHYFPRAHTSKVLDMSEITSAEVEIKHGRYSATVLKLSHTNGSNTELYFDTATEGFWWPKETVSKQLLEIAEAINQSVSARDSCSPAESSL